MHAVSRIVLLVPVFLQILSVLSLVFVNKKPEKVNYTIFQKAGHLQLYSGSCNLLKRMVVFKCVGYGNTKALFFFIITGIALLDTVKPSFTNVFSVHYFFQCTKLNQVSLLYRYFSRRLWPPKIPIQRFLSSLTSLTCFEFMNLYLFQQSQLT